jgi:hypothetical protein
MIETISFIILVILIFYSQIRRWLPRGGKMRCTACGRRIVEKPVEAEINGRKVYFCCEHCVAAYLQSERR